MYNGDFRDQRSNDSYINEYQLFLSQGGHHREILRFAFKNKISTGSSS